MIQNKTNTLIWFSHFYGQFWFTQEWPSNRANWAHKKILPFSIDQLSRCMTKPTKWQVCPAKTKISLGICSVWSESSMSAWRNLGSLATHWVHCEDTDQTGWMPRLIWVFAGHTGHFVYCVVLRLNYDNLFQQTACHQYIGNIFDTKWLNKQQEAVNETCSTTEKLFN